MKDMYGYEFNVGCKVARAVVSGRSPFISICTVTRIEDNRLYLDDSPKAINFPNRLLIIEQDQLYRMIKNHETTK